MEDATVRAVEHALQRVVDRHAFSGPDTPAFRQRLVRDAQAALDRLGPGRAVSAVVVRIADDAPLALEVWLRSPQRVERVVVRVEAM